MLTEIGKDGRPIPFPGMRVYDKEDDIWFTAQKNFKRDRGTCTIFRCIPDNDKAEPLEFIKDGNWWRERLLLKGEKGCRHDPKEHGWEVGDYYTRPNCTGDLSSWCPPRKIFEIQQLFGVGKVIRYHVSGDVGGEQLIIDKGIDRLALLDASAIFLGRDEPKVEKTELTPIEKKSGNWKGNGGFKEEWDPFVNDPATTNSYVKNLVGIGISAPKETFEIYVSQQCQRCGLQACMCRR